MALARRLGPREFLALRAVNGLLGLPGLLLDFGGLRVCPESVARS
jgi:hypothetical protein